MFDRITFDPVVMGGRACVRGMRITVALIVNLVANGMSTEQIIREYPEFGERRHTPVAARCLRAGERRDRFFQESCRLRFLADMGVSLTTVEALRAADPEIAAKAVTERRIVLTLIWIS